MVAHKSEYRIRVRKAPARGHVQSLRHERSSAFKWCASSISFFVRQLSANSGPARLPNHYPETDTARAFEVI
jgi:hypothetical protein